MYHYTTKDSLKKIFENLLSRALNRDGVFDSMRTNKYIIIITTSISVATLFICMASDQNTFIYDISLACFGSALLGGIIASVTYNSEKRKAMEQFWQTAREVICSIKKQAVPFRVDFPIDLVRYVLMEEERKNPFVKNAEECKRRLLDWIGENMISSDGDNPMPEKFDEKCEDLYVKEISNIRSKLIDAMKAYMTISEISLKELDNAYGCLDFITENNNIRRNIAYDKIFNPIRKFRNNCLKEAYHFNLELSGQGNIVVCFDKVIELDKEIFEDKEKESYKCTYAKYTDRLERNLELFRSKIYNCEPDYEDPMPISAVATFNKNI